MLGSHFWKCLKRCIHNDTPAVVESVDARGGAYEQFNRDALDVMRRAEQHAKSLNHEYIGTEHILLGLLDVRDDVVAGILDRFGNSEATIRKKWSETIIRGADAVVTGTLPLTPRAKVVVAFAREEAGRSDVAPEHVLMGLHREKGGVAAHLLNLAITDDILRNQIDAARQTRKMSDSA